MNCVLALKAYSDWKQGGGIGSWKLGGNLKPVTSGKHFVRKTSEPFMNSFSRTSSASEQSSLGDLGLDISEAVSELLFFSVYRRTVPLQSFVKALLLMKFLHGNLQAASRSLNVLIHQMLSDKKQEDIPIVGPLCHSNLTHTISQISAPKIHGWIIFSCSFRLWSRCWVKSSRSLNVVLQAKMDW